METEALGGNLKIIQDTAISRIVEKSVGDVVYRQQDDVLPVGNSTWHAREARVYDPRNGLFHHFSVRQWVELAPQETPGAEPKAVDYEVRGPSGAARRHEDRHDHYTSISEHATYGTMVGEVSVHVAEDQYGDTRVITMIYMSTPKEWRDSDQTPGRELADEERVIVSRDFLTGKVKVERVFGAAEYVRKKGEKGVLVNKGGTPQAAELMGSEADQLIARANELAGAAKAQIEATPGGHLIFHPQVELINPAAIHPGTIDKQFVADSVLNPQMVFPDKP